MKWELMHDQTYEAFARPFRLVVTRHMGLAPTAWRLRLEPNVFCIDVEGNLPLEEAQTMCINHAQLVLRKALTALD